MNYFFTFTYNFFNMKNVIRYSYVNNFLYSLMSIPVAFEMYSRLGDIIKRIN
jgi:ABC-type bacteriocin/lantibiotic exporter with double-glycine peptidase domain